MKKGIINFTIAAVFSVIFSSCEPEKEKPKQEAKVSTKYRSWVCDIKVIDVDSCEYIVAQTGTIDGGISIVHKQNCKYCVGRNSSKK